MLDRRDVRDRQGLIGIAIAVSRSGGCQVATRHGVIVEGTGKKPFYIPVDQYLVLPDDCPVHAGLDSIREDVLEEGFDLKEWAGERAKVTRQKAHNLEYKLMNSLRCKCKRGCNNKCGCIKAGVPCDINCKCRGGCKNPSNPPDSESESS